MVSITASTRQPPAGGPRARIDLDELLRELREGDRTAFERYFRRFRAPVHNFAWRLLHDERAAVAVTQEALTGAFRRAILDDGADDLEVLTYACALAACQARRDAAGAGEETRPVEVRAPASRGHRSQAAEALRQRFEGALESLEPRQRAALLLHDLAGLDAARSAAVLGVSVDVAAALLFKAREEFRTAQRGRGSYGAGRGCRQAEEALAGAVGLGLSEDQFSRLRRHAAYCRPCRKAMQGWAEAGAGLAVVLAEPPLPQALAATPVFDDLPEPAGAVAAHRRALAATGRTLRGRAAAWVLAVACLAVAAGAIVHATGVQPLVLMQSVGPAIRLIVTSPAGGEPAAARTVGQSSSEAAGATRISGAPAAVQLPIAAQSPDGSQRSGNDPAPAAAPDARPADARQVALVGSSDAPTQGSRTTAKVGRAPGKDGKAATKPATAAAKAAKAATKAAKAASKAAVEADKAEGRAHAAATSASSKATSGAAKASARASDKPAKASGKAAKASGRASAKASVKAAKASGKVSGKAAKASVKPASSAKASAKATKSKSASKSQGKKQGGSSHGSKKLG